MFDTVNVELSTIEDKDDPRDLDGPSCNDIERSLGHLPGSKALEKHQSHFRWKHRTLVKVQGLEAG